MYSDQLFDLVDGKRFKTDDYMKAANKSHSKMDVEMEILKRTSKQTLKYRVEVEREGTMLTSYTLMPNETR